MLKTIAVTLIGAGIIGTGAQTLPVDPVSPKTVELTAGTLMVQVGGKGISTKRAKEPGFAITVRLVKDQTLTLKF